MLTTEKTKHPLERHGTTQRERLIKALIPENLQLDDSSIADLVAFAGEYAKQIRYWSPENRPDGDWTGFWEKDATTLMAIVAATDIADIRVTYRNQELIFLRTCKKEKQDSGKSYCEEALKELHKLVGLIFDAVLKIQSLCEKLPASHPLKSEVQSLIREKLGIGKDANGTSRQNREGNKDYEKPIGTLISYHKVSYDIIKDPNDKRELIDLYAPIIGETPCQQAWGLTEHDFLTCIDYKATVDENDREALWRLFLTFFKVLTLIVSKAEKAFNLALYGRRDHPPHISLFLAFIQLFRRYHLADMNALLAKHLVFYYRDVLRLQERKEIPDRVHIVFEIAQNIETYRLQKNTLLLGGKDSKGLDLLYGLGDELVVNKAKLVERQTLYFYSVLQPGTTNQFSKIPIRLPVADMKDGLKVPYTEGGKMWHPLSGLEVFQKNFYKKEKVYFEESFNNIFYPKSTEYLVSTPGIIISSPELFMDKSDNRVITVTFGGNVSLQNLNLKISISTAEDLKSLNDYSLDPSNALNITIPASFPPITPLKEDETNPLSRFENPFLLIQAVEGEDYEAFKKIDLKSCSLYTHSEGLRNLVLQLGDTNFPATSEIPLIGSTTEQMLTLYATAPELSLKDIDFEQTKPEPIKDVTNFTFKGWVGKAKTRISKLNSNIFDNIGDIKYNPNSRYTFYKQEVLIKLPDSNKPINISCC